MLVGSELLNLKIPGFMIVEKAMPIAEKQCLLLFSNHELCIQRTLTAEDIIDNVVLGAAVVI